MVQKALIFLIRMIKDSKFYSAFLSDIPKWTLDVGFALIMTFD